MTCLSSPDSLGKKQKFNRLRTVEWNVQTLSNLNNPYNTNSYHIAFPSGDPLFIINQDLYVQKHMYASHAPKNL